jgi:hypothetical protein
MSDPGFFNYGTSFGEGLGGMSSQVASSYRSKGALQATDDEKVKQPYAFQQTFLCSRVEIYIFSTQW